MKFDPTLFESLGAFERSLYTARVIKGNVSEADILPYFLRNENTVDTKQLECLLVILAKVRSAGAYRVLANYLEHPNISIRLVAVKSIARMTAVDSDVMLLVVEFLREHQSDADASARACVRELRAALDHPADAEAAHIASEFKNEPAE